jgi:hypothetical protein
MKPQWRGEWECSPWGEEQEKAFKKINRAFTNVPALHLPDVMKPFFLYLHKRMRMAAGFLTQLLGFWHCLVA